MNNGIKHSNPMSKIIVLILQGSLIIYCLALILLIIQTTGSDAIIILGFNDNPDVKRLTDVNMIRRSLDKYKTDHGHYPITNAMCSSWVDDNGKKYEKYIPDFNRIIDGAESDASGVRRYRKEWPRGNPVQRSAAIL